MEKLSDHINIGKGIEAYLHEIGIHTFSDLKKMGSIKAWQKIRQKHPQKNVCICCLYALEGAIIGASWSELPADVKEALQKKVGYTKK